MRHYVLDKDNNPVIEPDLIRWAMKFEKMDRRVAFNVVGDKETSEISTVFLGLDHSMDNEGPPLIYETMIFGGEYDGTCERYSTKEEAVSRHYHWFDKLS